MAILDPAALADPVALTRALVDIHSVSGNEREIADAVETALHATGHLAVHRLGNTVAARTDLGRPARQLGGSSFNDFNGEGEPAGVRSGCDGAPIPPPQPPTPTSPPLTPSPNPRT